jgi:hypothetical protein
MNKRDQIIIIFRVVAVLILFVSFGLFPTIIYELTVSDAARTVASRLIKIILMIGIPLSVFLLLWNKSRWIADRILIPYEGETESDLDKPGSLTREEIESIACTVIAIYFLVSTIPEFIALLVLLLTDSSMTLSFEFKYLIAPLGKIGLASWLLFRSTYIIDWLKRLREAHA